MILLFQSSHDHYRLRAYNDFRERFPLHYPNVRVYGPQHDGLRNAPPHVIPHFHDGMPLDEVVTRYIGEEPEAIFLFSSSLLKRVGFTDFTKFKCPIFLLITDAISWDDTRIAALKMHKLKPFRAVFHNYLHKLAALKVAVPAESFVHYPCWAAHCYDSEAHPIDKDLQFLISGVPGGSEYTHRDLFAAATEVLDGEGRKPGLSAHSQLGERINEAEDNERFRRNLLRSMYSPHDGGVNGRLVPRYAESCFARSVIVSPDLGEEMRVGGYVSGKNCVLFNRGDYDTPEKCLRLLNEVKQRTDRAEMADHAYELARTRHCTDVRIRTFLEYAL